MGPFHCIYIRLFQSRAYTVYIVYMHATARVKEKNIYRVRDSYLY